MVAMVTPFKKTKNKYEKFIFDFKANFYTKFEENLKTWTYHLFFILHESYVNDQLQGSNYRVGFSNISIGISRHKNSKLTYRRFYVPHIDSRNQ